MRAGRGHELAHDRRTRLLIQRACGLVGEDDSRSGGQRAGDRHALGLTTRQLPGTPVSQSLQTQPVQDRAHPAHGVRPRHTGEHQRQGSILLGRQLREQLAGLEDEPEILAAQCRPAPVREP
ncbi:hypothetical protein GCM10028781_24100 [Nostocoides australiense]